MLLVTPKEELTRLYEADHYVLTSRGGTYIYYRPWEVDRALRLVEKIEQRMAQSGRKIKVRLIRKD